MDERDASAYGGFLGCVNTAFIAICVDATSDYHVVIAFCTFVFGIIPALLTGFILGAIGAAIGSWPVWLRRCLLAAPAVAVLLGLASCFGLLKLFLLPIIPTVIAALLLERRTRARPRVPIAIAK